MLSRAEQSRGEERRGEERRAPCAESPLPNDLHYVVAIPASTRRWRSWAGRGGPVGWIKPRCGPPIAARLHVLLVLQDTLQGNLVWQSTVPWCIQTIHQERKKQEGIFCSLLARRSAADPTPTDTDLEHSVRDCKPGSTYLQSLGFICLCPFLFL